MVELFYYDFFFKLCPSYIFNKLVGLVDISRMLSIYKITHSQYWESSDLVSEISHIPGSATHDLKPISSNFFAMNDRKGRTRRIHSIYISYHY